MKQINTSVLGEAGQDRNPNWCVLCDASDRCYTCDAPDFGNADCHDCDKGSEE